MVVITSLFAAACFVVCWMAHRNAVLESLLPEPNLASFDHYRQVAIGHFWMGASALAVTVEPAIWREPTTGLSLGGLIIWIGWPIGTFIFMRAQSQAKRGEHPLQLSKGGN